MKCVWVSGEPEVGNWMVPRSVSSCEEAELTRVGIAAKTPQIMTARIAFRTFTLAALSVVTDLMTLKNFP